MTELEEKEFNRKFDSWLDSEYDKYCEAEFDKYCQTLEQEKPKQLTQDVFKDAPDWVRSAAVDEDGYAWGYAVDTLFLSIDDNGDKWIANFGKCMCLGKGYDTTNWQQSAIDRE